MGRIEMLWGNATLPLRMQGARRSSSAARMRRWHFYLWRKALTSRPAWRRAIILSMISSSISIFLLTDVRIITLISVLTGAIALLAGSWAEVATLSRYAFNEQN